MNSLAGCGDIELFNEPLAVRSPEHPLSPSLGPFAENEDSPPWPLLRVDVLTLDGSFEREAAPLRVRVEAFAARVTGVVFFLDLRGRSS